MKITEKKKPIHTLPDGIWESSSPVQKEDKKKQQSTETTDLQKNGYPVNKQSK